MPSKLVDAYGRPVDMGALVTEVAAPKLVGLRNPWFQSIASVLTPQLLGAILHQVDMGDHLQYMTLCHEIEERWPHYFSVISTRKLAVSGLHLNIEAATDDDADVKMAESVREMIDSEMIAPLVLDMMDGVPKGYSCCEIQWDKSESSWIPRVIEHRDARFFLYDRFTGQELRIYDMADPAFGIPIPPYKFIVHQPRVKTGLPIKSGLARLALVPYLMQNYSLRDWLAFAESMGIPMRLGKHKETATADERKALLQAVRGIGVDAAAIIPDSMDITFEARGTVSSGDKIFQGLVEHFDKAISKAVLGQTSTTEGQPGKLGAEDVQDKVREDIRTNDALQIAATIRRDLIRPVVDLNFGPQPRGRYPTVTLSTEKKEDLAQLSTALAPFIDRGLRVEESVIRDKFGLPEPEDGASVLVPATKGAPGQLKDGTPAAGPVAFSPEALPKPLPTLPTELPIEDGEVDPKTNPDFAEREAMKDPHIGKQGLSKRVYGPSKARAQNQAIVMSADDVLALADEIRHGRDTCDDLADEGAAGWRRTVGPLLDEVKRLAREATDEEDLAKKLAKLHRSNSGHSRALVDEVARLTFQARGLGDARDKP